MPGTPCTAARKSGDRAVSPPDEDAALAVAVVEELVRCRCIDWPLTWNAGSAEAPCGWIEPAPEVHEVHVALLDAVDERVELRQVLEQRGHVRHVEGGHAGPVGRAEHEVVLLPIAWTLPPPTSPRAAEQAVAVERGARRARQPAAVERHARDGADHVRQRGVARPSATASPFTKPAPGGQRRQVEVARHGDLAGDPARGAVALAGLAAVVVPAEQGGYSRQPSRSPKSTTLGIGSVSIPPMPSTTGRGCPGSGRTAASRPGR